MKIRINDVYLHKSFLVDADNVKWESANNEQNRWANSKKYCARVGKNKWYGHFVDLRPGTLPNLNDQLLISKRTYDRIFGDIWESQKNNG